MAGEKGAWQIVARISDDEKKIFRTLQDLPAGLEQSAFPECIVIEWTYGGDLPDSNTGQLLQQFEDHLWALDDPQQNSLQVLAITGNGKREWCYYARNYDAFMAALNAALAGAPRFPINIEHSTDADWVYWTKIREIAASEVEISSELKLTPELLAAEPGDGPNQAKAAQIAAYEAVAKQIAAKVFKLMNPQPIEYVAVNPDQFTDIDLAFYQRLTQELRACGFDRIVDTEPLHHTRSQGKRLLLRFLLSASDCACASIYSRHPPQGKAAGFFAKLLGKKPARHGTIEFETEFSNGEFVSTDNAEGKNPFSPSPAFHKLRLPPDTPLREVLEQHRRRVAEFKNKFPGLDELKLDNLNDLTERGKRQRLLSIRHRRSIGGITRDELQGLAKEKFPYVEENVMKEMRRLIAESDKSGVE